MAQEMGTPDREAAVTGTVAEYSLPDLLGRAGARRITDKRADCPRCGGRRTVSYTDELFHCFQAGCGFKGNALTLARELGLAESFSAEERRALARIRAQAQQAAAWLTAKLRARRFQLYDAHQELLSIIYGASHRLGRLSGDESAWLGLAYAYPELDTTLAELALLENAPIADRLTFLQATPQARREMVRRVTEDGGLWDGQGRFVEVEIHCPAGRTQGRPEIES